MIKGMTVQLAVKTQTGTDTLNAPVYSTELVDVENVLVGQPTTEQITDSVNLYGKKLVYMLGIPRGDTHDWTDTEVYIRGEKFRTFGLPIRGVDDNIPGPWNQNVRVERYG